MPAGVGFRCGVCAVWCLLGCASASAARVPDPDVATSRFAEALERDQPEVAYDWLDPELRAALDRERFLRLWRENRAELLELGEQLRARHTRPITHAQVSSENGEAIALVLQDGRWRIAGGVLDAQALDTPLGAVAELRRALERQSLPSLLRVLSRERRAAWLATFAKTVEQTGDPLDLRVEVQGDDAIVHLSAGGEIHLKREAGRWHVWDVR